MGIAKGVVHLLGETKRDVPEFKGDILQLGRQHTFLNPRQLQTIINKFGIYGGSPESEFDINRVCDDLEIFSALGFQKIESLDYSSF